MTNHIPFQGNRENLRKLIDGAKEYATRRPQDFDMSTFASSGATPFIAADYHKCGTTACFAGIGPMVEGLEPVAGESWYDYIERLFGVEDISDDWEWLFSGDWSDVAAGEDVGSIWHAIARAEYILERGVPEGWGRMRYPDVVALYQPFVQVPE